jgi:hypothetical protein
MRVEKRVSLMVGIGELEVPLKLELKMETMFALKA